MNEDQAALWTERKEAEFRKSLRWNWPIAKLVIIVLFGPYLALTSVIGLAQPNVPPWGRVGYGVECFLAGLITAWYFQQWLIAKRASARAADV